MEETGEDTKSGNKKIYILKANSDLQSSGSTSQRNNRIGRENLSYKFGEKIYPTKIRPKKEEISSSDSDFDSFNKSKNRRRGIRHNTGEQSVSSLFSQPIFKRSIKIDTLQNDPIFSDLIKFIIECLITHQFHVIFCFHLKRIRFKNSKCQNPQTCMLKMIRPNNS